MRFWAGVTDNRWYQFVGQRRFDEVNFWQPSARPPFTGLPAGTPFLFKLRRPHHDIAGGGFFVRYTRLPFITAWEVFGEQNGAASLRDLQVLIAGNRAAPVSPDTEIGCTVLTDVFFLPRERWVPIGERFASNIVRGRTYDTVVDRDAEVLWREVRAAGATTMISESTAGDDCRYGNAFLMRARLGQGSFRTLVIDAYRRRCAMTGESTLPTLEAAHIQSYAEHGPHQVCNGLLLRSDFHKLFDAGLVTVEPDYHIRISGRIRGQYFNGKAYYRLHGRELAGLPDDSQDRPNPDFLRWHNENRFIA